MTFKEKKIEEFDIKFKSLRTYGNYRLRENTILFSWLLSFIAESIDEAYEQGKADGMKLEAVGCFDHCEQARAEERREILEFVRNNTTKTNSGNEFIDCELLKDYLTKK